MSTSRRPVALLVGVVILAVAGAAFAYWLTTGGGSGAGASGSTTPVSLSGGTPSSQLAPGGQTAVVLTVSNPNSASVRVGSLVLDTGQGTNGFSVDAGHSACGVGALSFATQTNGGAGWTVPGGGTLPVTLPNALSMTTGAANTCQGATFTVYLTAAS
jgi:hypothetical protein